MNNFLIGVIAAIAAVFAAVLFGRPKGQTDDTPPSIEQVDDPSLPPGETAPVTIPPPPVRDTVAAVESLPVSSDEPSRADISHEEMVDPWAELSEMNAVTAEPAAAARSMPPFAAIHDPKRPSTSVLQDLSQEIVSMGSSGKLSDIPKLIQYRQHDDPLIRCYVVYAIGEIAAVHPLADQVQAAIAILAEMTDDPELQVREMAYKALSRIPSPDVQPHLEKGLSSSSSGIKQLINAALQKLKLQNGTVADRTDDPPALPENPH